jgi:hypothetical protein
MSTVRFLCDEDVPVKLLAAVLGLEPGIDIVRVGEEPAPPKNTPDPVLLLAAESQARLLLTMDRSSMPRHVADHLAAGHHTWGVFMLKQRLPISRYVDDIILLWAASEAEEWQDRTGNLPFARVSS